MRSYPGRLGLALCVATLWTGVPAQNETHPTWPHSLADPDAAAVVAVFVRRDCPISNRYAPELRRLHEKFALQGVRFWLVFPEPDATEESIARYLEAYQLPFSTLADPDHTLVRATGVRITPEVAVYAGQQLAYRGRIDDLYPSLGHRRAAPTTHDLERALESVLAGERIGVPRTTAVGCAISPPP